MLHYTERKNKIHIITLDSVLADDIYQRITEYSAIKNVELILPAGGKETITPTDILKSARDTTDSRLLIIDVRTQTKPKLQQAYSDIVRFNRPDLNNYCYTVLIGDGPASFLLESKGINAFQSYLADLRRDYSPAVFFGNPFLYYTHKELLDLAMYHDNALPDKIPQRLEKFFKPGIPVKTVYEFFRAAGETPEKKKKRLSKLKEIYLKIVTQDFPNDVGRLETALKKHGCDFPGETLKLNTYPFYFEQWIADLLLKAQAAQ
ncbi:MAG: hypothetical protein LLF92_10575 [Planctomycetaceae bacterium]|nr:hypothetical protein [Planctomycetaceae bacterium]